MYEYGRGVLKDPVQALDWYGKAAAHGDSYAQHKLTYATTGVNGTLDYRNTPALGLYHPFTTGDDGGAYDQIATSYRTGLGAPKNPYLAVYWYRQAFRRGCARAGNELGMMYEQGDGVPKNFARAFYWYALASDHGDADARKNLDRLIAELFLNVVPYILAFTAGGLGLELMALGIWLQVRKTKPR